MNSKINNKQLDSRSYRAMDIVMGCQSCVQGSTAKTNHSKCVRYALSDIQFASCAILNGIDIILVQINKVQSISYIDTPFFNWR